jgi:dipeptidyl aminopeptidase/acylaminoacyl peptidase
MPRLPLEDFFRKPERANPQLSPDGTHLAFLAPHERRLNVFVRDLATRLETRVTNATERDIAGYVWADDERLVYARDQGGDENYRLYSVGKQGEDPLDLTPFEGVKCAIIDDLEEVPDQILIQMNRRNPQIFDVWRLNVSTGELELAAENPGNVQHWMTDHDGRLRLATTTDGVGTSILFRESEEDAWREVAAYDFKESASPLSFTFDNQAIYVASNVGRDRSAIFEYDLERGREVKLLWEHPEVDVAGLICSKKRRVILGVAFETDRPGRHYFDDERRRIQEFLDERLPGRLNNLVSHARDESRFVVLSRSDRVRGAYHLLSVGAAGELELEPLFESAPWLAEAELAECQPIRYTSRDGLTIHGYLTLPPEVEARALPLVVLPHGGPWHRDSWGFDPDVQFLANRGLAVLQMNFRGSTGYGRAFWEASFGQWGLSMQDDITDGVGWIVEQGIADPQRIAIYGGSYGGYAALSGLVKTPELYACGVSYVGVSNLFTWIEAFPPYWKPFLEMIHEMVGHPERDAERWRANSPFFNADAIRVPLLVVQGANDPRVRKEESDQIVEALRSRGVEVDYIVKEDEGHGFVKEENLFEFYRALESFLQRHLGLEA